MVYNKHICIWEYYTTTIRESKNPFPSKDNKTLNHPIQSKHVPYHLPIQDLPPFLHIQPFFSTRLFWPHLPSAGELCRSNAAKNLNEKPPLEPAVRENIPLHLKQKVSYLLKQAYVNKIQQLRCGL